MKRLFCAVLAACMLSVCACGRGGANGYVLTEKTFFMVMTNIQYYTEIYLGKDLELDCFIYELTDIYGNVHVCAVRKCSSGYGCTCGKDTVIGFLLEFEGYIPPAKNQSEDSPDKTWVHLKGKIKSTDKTDIKIYAYNGDQIDYSNTETISFLTFRAESLELISDYSGLQYYVTK